MPKNLWVKGQSGNPKGRTPRPKGRPLAEILTREDAEAVLMTVIQAAQNGDLHACKLILDRTFPALKPVDAPINIGLPADPIGGAVAVIGAVADGEITPDQAARLTGVLADLTTILKATELEQRIAALEQRTDATN